MPSTRTLAAQALAPVRRRLAGSRKQFAQNLAVEIVHAFSGPEALHLDLAVWQHIDLLALTGQCSSQLEKAGREFTIHFAESCVLKSADHDARQTTKADAASQ